MRVTVLTVESRGDAQPYLALAVGLRASGTRCDSPRLSASATPTRNAGSRSGRWREIPAS